MKTAEIVGIVIACMLGCAIIEIVGYFAGWSHSVGDAIGSWLIYSVCTSLVVILYSIKKR